MTVFLILKSFEFNLEEVLWPEIRHCRILESRTSYNFRIHKIMKYTADINELVSSSNPQDSDPQEQDTTKIMTKH